jgi:hypothetical protein
MIDKTIRPDHLEHKMMRILRMNRDPWPDWRMASRSKA